MDAISAFDIFKIGVGPSSSHTMGPWRAAQQFLAKCRDRGYFDRIAASTPISSARSPRPVKGHGTDFAILMGLTGEDPVTCDTAQIHTQVESIHIARIDPAGWNSRQSLSTGIGRPVFNGETALPFHPNGLRFTAFARRRHRSSRDVSIRSAAASSAGRRPSTAPEASSIPSMPID